MNNQMSWTRYFCNNIVWSVYFCILFRSTIFACLPGMTYSDSVSTFYWLIAICVLIGIVVNHNTKCGYTAFINSIYAIPIYMLISYAPIFLVVSTYFKGFCICLLAAPTIIMLTKIIPAIRNNNATKAYKAISVIGFRFYYLFFAVLLVPMSLILWNYIRDGSAMTANTETYSGHVDSMAYYSESLEFLQEEQWKKLNAEQKIDVLQVVANIEKDNLGLPHELNVVASAVNKNVGAHYDYRKHRITLGLGVLTYYTAEQAVNTIMHEVRHAYQYQLVELYNSLTPEQKQLKVFEESYIPNFTYELENYININEDYESYYNQFVEIDARLYENSSKYSEYLFD